MHKNVQHDNYNMEIPSLRALWTQHRCANGWKFLHVWKWSFYRKMPNFRLQTREVTLDFPPFGASKMDNATSNLCKSLIKLHWKPLKSKTQHKSCKLIPPKNLPCLLIASACVQPILHVFPCARDFSGASTLQSFGIIGLMYSIHPINATPSSFYL